MNTTIRRTLLAIASLFAVSATNSSEAAVTFPNDTVSQLVNVIRRYDNGVPLYSVTQLLTGTPGTPPPPP